jgi:hypothetical protein
MMVDNPVSTNARTTDNVPCTAILTGNHVELKSTKSEEPLASTVICNTIVCRSYFLMWGPLTGIPWAWNQEDRSSYRIAAAVPRPQGWRACSCPAQKAIIHRGLRPTVYSESGAAHLACHCQTCNAPGLDISGLLSRQGPALC